MTDKLKELFRLIEENPDLPIVPMVDSELVCDDTYGRWMGEFGNSHIDEYIIPDEEVVFRDDDHIEDILPGVIGWDAFDNMSDEEAMAEYQKINWTKAIIVNIDVPD